jgi:hypothetical protein
MFVSKSDFPLTYAIISLGRKNIPATISAANLTLHQILSKVVAKTL